MTNSQNNEVALQELESWRQKRHEYVTGARGPLSLVETRWFAPDTTADQAAQLQEQERALNAAKSEITVTNLERLNAVSGNPEYGLRVWDKNSQANQIFEGITAFDYNPDWVLTGVFTPGEAETQIPFEHVRDDKGLTRMLAVPGTVTLTHAGETFELIGFVSGDILLVPVADQTTGAIDPATGEPSADSSYAPMRFVPIAATAAVAGFTQPGEVVLDFNRAYVPPCGFSAQFNCPMAPSSNRLPWRILAGEKRPQFANNTDIHTLT